MLLNEIFDKDVHREIDGVIYADRVIHLATEVEEYVVTNEVAKGLEGLLEAYTNYTNANGVWISGFFGCGKSHLLKMLAHLLGDVEGQDFDRQRVVESFRSKADNSILTASLAKAEQVTAKSLLFNIDQKADLITKDETDALLKVFVKVFDDSCGYYGKQGHVAQFERVLDKQGKYADFKHAFERIAGTPWTQGREEGALQNSNIDSAVAEVTGNISQGIIAQYQKSYAVSIEDFADVVKAWLDKQPDGYRLNFFVDEVGQFIGSNTHLMLNLQTVVETLNTKCEGRAWVFVTSQEDMDSVVGDITKQQSNDFSKIQARFETRVKLTSADVEEVIRKRLLEKNSTGETELGTLYEGQSANFKTLFDFVDGSKTYRNYTGDAHFIGTYPFVGYQFPLFQASMRGISDHNVFEGRNSSVGERSMLGVVQQVTKDIGTSEVGSLATFDQMFEGIRDSIKSAARSAIDLAEHQLENKLAIQLLKTLFLVKYVESFHATARNLTVLVYDRFGLDLPALEEAVKEALTLLETQTYVQRKGNVYEYLTDEEQKIEAEIKNVDIDASEVSDQLFKTLSGDVLKTNKIPYEKTGQAFPFSVKLDDQVHGQQKELSVHFITPDYAFSPEDTKAHSAGKDELLVILDPDERVLSDLRLMLKTRKYTKQKKTTALLEVEDQILHSKAALNSEREKELVQRIQSAVGKAELIVNAGTVDASSHDALGRVTQGFQELLGRTYTHLNLLGGVAYSEEQVAGAADPESGVFDADARLKLNPASDEVMSFILQREGLGEQVTMKTIVDRHQSKPYGWDLASIEVVVASLIGMSKVAMTVDGNALKRSEVASALRNTQKHSHAILAPQKSFDDGKVSAFRKFCTDFFDEGSPPTDPLELGAYGQDKLKGKLNELKEIVSGSSYPFVEQLGSAIDLLEQAAGKPDDWYLENFDAGDELLDAKENLLDPIQSFLNGSQRSIYDEASTLLASNSGNLTYLPSGSHELVGNALLDPDVFRGNKMAQLKKAVESLRNEIAEAVSSKRTVVTEGIQSRLDELVGSDDYAQATPEAQQSVGAQVAALIAEVAAESQVAVILQIQSKFESSGFPDLFDVLSASRKGGETPKQTVAVTTISVADMSGVLESDEDVDSYLIALRVALVEVLKDGKRISL